MANEWQEMVATIDALDVPRLQLLADRVREVMRQKIANEQSVQSLNGQWRFNTVTSLLEQKGPSGWERVSVAWEVAFRTLRTANIIPADYQQLYSIARQLERVTT